MAHIAKSVNTKLFGIRRNAISGIPGKTYFQDSWDLIMVKHIPISISDVIAASPKMSSYLGNLSFTIIILYINLYDHELKLCSI